MSGLFCDVFATMNDETTDSFSIGHVLTLAISTLFRHFLSFAVVGFIAFAPVLIIAFVGGVMFGSLVPDAMPDDQADGSLSPAAMLVIGLTLIIALVAWGLFNGAVVDGTFRFLSNRRVSIGGGIRRGMNRALTIIGIMIVLILMTIAAFLPIMIPIQVGVIPFNLVFILIFFAVIFLVYTYFYVVVPVCVVEDAGVIGSFQRSLVLTKGFRWRVLGIILFAGILQVLVNTVGTAITEAIQENFGGVGAIFAAVGQLVLSLAVLMWSAILPAVAYFELRRVKEGIGVEHLANVFD